MTSVKLIGSIAMTGVLGLAGALSTANAGERKDSDWLGPKFYVGGGASFAKIDDVKVRDRDVSTGDLSNFDDDHATWQAFAGAMFTPWLGVEAGYLDLPKFKDKGFKIDGKGYTATGMLVAPLGDRVELYGKGGRVWWDVDADGPVGFERHVGGSDWLYGAGLNVGVLPNVSLRFEYVRYDLHSDSAKGNLDLATAGVQYNF